MDLKEKSTVSLCLGRQKKGGKRAVFADWKKEVGEAKLGQKIALCSQQVSAIEKLQ